MIPPWNGVQAGGMFSRVHLFYYCPPSDLAWSTPQYSKMLGSLCSAVRYLCISSLHFPLHARLLRISVDADMDAEAPPVMLPLQKDAGQRSLERPLIIFHAISSPCEQLSQVLDELDSVTTSRSARVRAALVDTLSPVGVLDIADPETVSLGNLFLDPSLRKLRKVEDEETYWQIPYERRALNTSGTNVCS